MPSGGSDGDTKTAKWMCRCCRVLEYWTSEGKAVNRKMFLIILHCLRYLARQGIGIRGHDDDSNSNFIQLLHLRPLTTGQGQEKKNKYTAPCIQNECLRIMTLSVLRNIAWQHLQQWLFHCNGRWVHGCRKQRTIYHLHPMGRRKSICPWRLYWLVQCWHKLSDFKYRRHSSQNEFEFVTVPRTVLRWCFEHGRQQEWRGYTDPSRGIPCCLYTHCYGHALNLAVGDALKKSTPCCDALDTAFEICRLSMHPVKLENAGHEWHWWQLDCSEITSWCTGALVSNILGSCRRGPWAVPHHKSGVSTTETAAQSSSTRSSLPSRQVSQSRHLDAAARRAWLEKVTFKICCTTCVKSSILAHRSHAA